MDLPTELPHSNQFCNANDKLADWPRRNISTDLATTASSDESTQSTNVSDGSHVSSDDDDEFYSGTSLYSYTDSSSSANSAVQSHDTNEEGPADVGPSNFASRLRPPNLERPLKPQTIKNSTVRPPRRPHLSRSHPGYTASPRTRGLFYFGRPSQSLRHPSDPTANSHHDDQQIDLLPWRRLQQNSAPDRPSLFNAFGRVPDLNAHHGTTSQQRPRMNHDAMPIMPMQRQDTSEMAQLYSGGNRSRFKISLWQGNPSAVDEEMGLGFSKHETPGAADHSSKAMLSPELLEILQTRWIPTDEGSERATLTVKDSLNEADGTKVPTHMRWL